MLRLAEHGPDARAAGQLPAHAIVGHAAETCEHFQFEELRIIEPERRRGLAQGGRLRLAADAADAEAYVDRRLLALVKKAGVEHDLAIGDRDQIGRNIGAEIAGVGFRDRQGGQRAAAFFARQFGGAFQQAGVNVENIAWIGLAAGRLAGQQGDFAMAGGVFGEVVHHHQSMLPAIAEIFGDSDAGERRDPLQAGRRGGAGDHDDATLRRALGENRLDRASDAGAFLADGDIDADHVAGLLVDDRIDRQSGLADRPVADDQLALAAPEGEKGVDDENPGLDRLGDEIALRYGRRRPFDRVEPFRRDRPLAVERPTERIDHAAEQTGPDWRAQHVARAARGVAGFDRLGRIDQHTMNAVLVERMDEAENSVVELQHFVEPHIRQAGNFHHAVADFLDPSNFLGARAERHAVEPRLGLLQPFFRSRLIPACHLSALPVMGQLRENSGEIGAPGVAQGEMRTLQLQTGDQRRIDGERQLRRRAERRGQRRADLRLFGGIERRRGDQFDAAAIDDALADLFRLRGEPVDQPAQKGGAHRRAVETRRQPTGDRDREPPGLPRPFLLGVFPQARQVGLGRDARPGGFGLRLLQQDASGFGGLLPGRGQDRLALLSEAVAALLRFGQGLRRVLAIPPRLFEQVLGLPSPLLDQAGDGPPEEPSENPDQDQDIDGLKAEGPPVEGHFSNGLAKSSRRAMTRQ